MLLEVFVFPGAVISLNHGESIEGYSEILYDAKVKILVDPKDYSIIISPVYSASGHLYYSYSIQSHFPTVNKSVTFHS